jgi:multiple sugar transport system substrate-binding protein
MYEQLVDWWNKYQERDTRIHVVLDTVSGGATAEHSEMLADAQAGSTDYDIYNLDNEWVPEFAAAGFVRSLPAGVATPAFLPLPLDSGSYAGRLYAMPFTTDVGLLYYRSDQVSAAQVKALGSFTDLVKLASQSVVAGPHPAIGYAGQFADYEGLTVNLLEIMNSDDPNVFAADGTVRDGNAVTQGLQQLYDAMYLTGVIPPAELGYTESQAFTAFAGGQALFMRNWPIYYELLRSASVKGASVTAGHFAVAPLPFPSVLGGQDLAVSAGSRHPAAALSVIKFLTSAQAERCLFAVGGFPATRQSAYPQGAPLPSEYNGVSGHPLCGTQPGPSPQIGHAILTAIGQAFLRPRTPYYTEFTGIVTDQVPQLLNGTTKLGDLVQALEASLTAAAAGRAPPLGTEPGAAPAGTPAASR